MHASCVKLPNSGSVRMQIAGYASRKVAVHAFSRLNVRKPGQLHERHRGLSCRGDRGTGNIGFCPIPKSVLTLFRLAHMGFPCVVATPTVSRPASGGRLAPRSRENISAGREDLRCLA
jgi:hypothetical protein